MAIDIVMLVALVVAAVWVWLQQKRLDKCAALMKDAEQHLRLMGDELTATKEQRDKLVYETMLVKHVLLDVAQGEAHVWIEDGELKATRTADRKTPIH